MKKIIFAATAALFAVGTTAAMAQGTTAPATTAPKATAPLAKAPAAPSVTAPSSTTPAAKAAGGRKVATTEIGKQCSAEADAQSLKGKPRQAFRAKCKKLAAAKKN
jgi:psiF repeat